MSSSESAPLVTAGLSVHYPEREEPALREVTEEISSGEAVVITGPSGCGKSTFFRTVAGFVPEMIEARVSGDVRLYGRSVWERDPADIATRVGLVQQDPDAQICTLNVRQEVAFGPENLCLPVDEVRSRVGSALEVAGITHLTSRKTTSLSGGEKQRLAIASILAMNPELILLDEPTANLDPAGAETIFDLLQTLREQEGRTLIIAEHRLAPLLGLSPRLLVIDRGQVVARRETRTHEDLMALGLRAKWDLEIEPARNNGGYPVDAKDLTFGYGDTPLFEDLSLRLEPGDIIGIIGPNGGGKTSLLRLLARLERPREGEVSFDGKARVGFVFQHPHQQIFERTVRGELAIEGINDEDRLTAILDEARLAGLADMPPLSLSLGEQRRLTVATTFARDPNVILLDEPFIGQDRQNVAWIIARILSARERGAIIVLVSHDIPLVAALCSRLLFLGEEMIDGPTPDVLARLDAAGQEAYLPDYWEGVTE